MDLYMKAVKKAFKQDSKTDDIQGWKEGLNSEKEDKRKSALKKIIIALSVGKDVSSLKNDVLRCGYSAQNNILEIKKLVYLYVVSHAKTHSDILRDATKLFLQDARSPNPMVRALSIRTIASINNQSLLDQCDTLIRQALQDSDPYVRKTATLAVAKLHFYNPDRANRLGVVEALQDMLTDPNITVVANVVIALSEISSNSENLEIKMSPKIVSALVNAMEGCSEYGKVFILESLMKYTPKHAEEAEELMDRILPILQSENAAVSLGGIKFLIKLLSDHFPANKSKQEKYFPRLAPVLITLLSSAPEIQYVALRNMQIVMEKFPNLLINENRVFFCRYNDPIFVKMEKLDILVKMANERNISDLLNEFREYASEIDVEFVRKSVRAIGLCAIKANLEHSAQRCVDLLLDLIQTKVNYVVQEAIIVIRDIFRKYPNKYESIIGILCENLDTLDDEHAKASMIWIIGEYCDRIENADELLQVFIDNFLDEPIQVKLQLLTAVVKLFLHRPTETQEMLTHILTTVTEQVDHPDVRDRGFMYWRLLSADPDAAKAVILADKPELSEDSHRFDEALLKALLPEMSTLASIYHKPPEMFVANYKNIRQINTYSVSEERDEEIEHEEYVDDQGSNGQHTNNGSGNNARNNGDMLLNLEGDKPTNGLTTDDLFGFKPTTNNQVPQNIVLTADAGRGLQVSNTFTRVDGTVLMNMRFTNFSPQPMSSFALQMNKNAFGFAPGRQPEVSVVMPGQSADVSIPLVPSGNSSQMFSEAIQVAIKNNFGVFYFQDKLPGHVVLVEAPPMDKQQLVGIWRSMPDEGNQQFISVQNSNSFNALVANPGILAQKFATCNLSFVVERQVPNGPSPLYYFSATTANNAVFVVEVSIVRAQGCLRCCVKGSNMEMASMLWSALNFTVSTI